MRVGVGMDAALPLWTFAVVTAVAAPAAPEVVHPIPAPPALAQTGAAVEPGFAETIGYLSGEMDRASDLGRLAILSDCLVAASWYSFDAGGFLKATFSFRDMTPAIADQYDPIEDLDALVLTCRAPGCVEQLSARGFAYRDDAFAFIAQHDAYDPVEAALSRALRLCGAGSRS